MLAMHGRPSLSWRHKRDSYKGFGWGLARGCVDVEPEFAYTQRNFLQSGMGNSPSGLARDASLT